MPSPNMEFYREVAFYFTLNVVGDHLRRLRHDRSIIGVVLRCHANVSLHEHQGTIDDTVKRRCSLRVRRSSSAVS